MTQQNVKGAAQLRGIMDERKQMPTLDEVYGFIKSHYKAERFELRNSAPGTVWENYSESVAKSHLEALKKKGFSNISRHEDRAGNGFFFNTKLEVLQTSPYCKK